MTEERFFAEDFDEIYFIFDRTKLNNKVDKDDFSTYSDSLSSQEVVDMLNTLNEEKEYWKQKSLNYESMMKKLEEYARNLSSIHNRRFLHNEK